jgi:hypothetical protein
MYYCFHCDQPADEHREGSCRSCGMPVTPLVEKGQIEQVAEMSIIKKKKEE